MALPADRIASLNKDMARLKYENHLWSRYGKDLAWYDQLLEKQQGRCAICGTSDPKSKNGFFVVDHNHASGRVRGLLCHRCNTGIGFLGDSFSDIARALEYLLPETLTSIGPYQRRAWLFQNSRRKKNLGEDKCPWSVGWIDNKGKRRSRVAGSRESAEEVKRIVEEILNMEGYPEDELETEETGKWMAHRE